MKFQRGLILLASWLSSTSSSYSGPFDLSALNLKSVKSPKIISNESGFETRPIGTVRTEPEITINLAASSNDDASTSPLVLSRATSSNELIFDLNKKSTTTAIEKVTRKRKFLLEISPAMSVEQVIDVEISRYGFKKGNIGRIAQFRKTLNLIASNNLQEFIKDETNFKTELGKIYTSFSSGDIRYYLLRHMILFGSYDMVDLRWKASITITDEKFNIEEVVRWLVNNRSFETVIRLFAGKFGDYKIAEDAQEKIKLVLNEKYSSKLPSNSFKRLFIQLIGLFHAFDSDRQELVQCFLDNDKNLAFDRFIGFLDSAYYLGNKDLKVMAEFVLREYREEFKILEISKQFLVVKLALMADDVGILEDIFSLNLDLVMYAETNRLERSYYSSPSKMNILTLAIEKRASNCVRLLVDLAKELITASDSDMISGLEKTFKVDSVDILEIIEENEFDHNYTVDVTIVDNSFSAISTGTTTIDTMNLIQLAVHYKSDNIIRRYVEKLGPEEVLTEVLKKWSVSCFENQTSFEWRIRSFNDYLVSLLK